MTEPVIVGTVAFYGVTHHLRERYPEVCLDGFLCPLDDPRYDVRAGVLQEELAVVLFVAASGDPCGERYDDESPPDACIHRTDSRQMVRVQDERMARSERERVLVLLLCEDLICGAELLDQGGVQPHPFLQLSSDQQPFTLCLCQLRLDVPLTADRQGVRGDVAAVAAEDPGEDVPEGGFAVSAITVGDDQRLDVNVPDHGETDDLLHIGGMDDLPFHRHCD